MNLAKKNKHKRDRYVKLHPDYENNHIYLIHRQPHTEKGYKSVTTYIKQFFDEFDTNEIIDTYYEKWQETKHPNYYGLSKNEIKDLWEEKRDIAAKEGTAMHQLFEDFANYQPSKSDIKSFLSEAKNWVEWFVNNNITPFRTEYTVYGAKEKLVGNIDFIFLNEDGEFCIADYKRATPPSEDTFGRVCKGINLPHNNRSKHIIQLNIYKQLLEKYYDLKIAKLYNIYAKEDNFTIIEQPIIEYFFVRKGK